jgi:hypothetical protein
MAFFPLKYTHCYSSLYLNEDEWILMINNFVDSLRTKIYGRKLIERLEYYLSKGYTFECVNKDSHGYIIFPKSRYISDTHALIVIPSIPYFINIDTINATKLSKIENNKYFSCFDDFNKLLKYEEIEDVLKSDHITTHELNEFSFQPYFFIFVHELIHIIRFFENIHLRGEYEESATIYGLNNKSLYIDKLLITENTIRAEWKYPPRISHHSQNLYVDDIIQTHENRHLFSKDSFFKF